MICRSCHVCCRCVVYFKLICRVCRLFRMNASNSHPNFEFSTSEGHQLTRSVLRPLLPYDPHDDQLEGVCKMADGVDLMALMRTGSGKTGYFTMHMLLLIALSKDPTIVAPFKLKRKVPANPAMVIVFPTNGVEEEMVRKYNNGYFLSTNFFQRSSSFNDTGLQLWP